MDLREIVIHEVKRDRRDVVLNLLREPIGEPREPAHVHTHRQVLALYEARADFLLIRGAADDVLFSADAFSRAVLPGLVERGPVNLYQYGVINLPTKGAVNRVDVELEPIRGDLNPVSKAALEVIHKIAGRLGVAATDNPRGNELGFRVDGRPCPNVSGPPFRIHFGRDVLLLGIDERPDFIAFKSIQLQILKGIILVIKAGRADVSEQFQDGILGNPSHAHGGVNRNSLYESGYDLDALFAA